MSDAQGGEIEVEPEGTRDGVDMTSVPEPGGAAPARPLGTTPVPLDGAAPARLPGTDPARPSRDATGDLWFRLAFAVCAVAALLPIWAVTYLPMTDLPQHAVQIRLWQQYDDPGAGYAQNLEFQWFNPYLLGYALWRLLACFMSIPVACQAVVSLAVLALPCAYLLWFRVTRQTERWWALLGFPLAYSFNFYLGSINFLLAVPLGLAGLAVAWWYAERPGGRRGVAVILAAAVLLLAHGLVLGFFVLVAGALVVAKAPSWRGALARLWPLAWLVLPAGMYAAKLWLEAAHGQSSVESDWTFEPGRLRDLPDMIVGLPGDWPAVPWLLAVVALGAFVLRPRGAGPPASEAPDRVNLPPNAALTQPAVAASDDSPCPPTACGWGPWIPLGVTLAVTLLGPRLFAGTWLVPYRFAGFLAPAAWAALRTRVRARHRVWFRAALAALALAWLALLAVRFAGFEEETRSFRALLKQLPPGQRIQPLIFARDSNAVSGVMYQHFALWYEVEKGGRAGFSFMQLGRTLLRFRPGHEDPMDEGLAWQPQDFSWARDGNCDAFLVRADRDPGAGFFLAAGGQARLLLRAVPWYLYVPVRRELPGPQRPGPGAGLGLGAPTPRSAEPPAAGPEPRVPRNGPSAGLGLGAPTPRSAEPPAAGPEPRVPRLGLGGPRAKLDSAFLYAPCATMAPLLSRAFPIEGSPCGRSSPTSSPSWPSP